MSNQAPFRYDVVGSFLRPEYLKDARAKFAEGKITEEQLKETVLFEQLKKLGLIEDKPKTGYERREECNNKKYYFVNTIDLVIENENTVLFDQNRYDVGNYYSDKTIAENNARADRLLRCLRQWQAQNDKVISVSDWKNEGIIKYFIAYNYRSSLFEIGRCSRRREPNIIYFTTKDKVSKAVKNFRDELEWYFTEYQQRLDEE